MAGLAHPEDRDPDLAAVTAHAVAAVHTLTPATGEVTGRAG